MAETATVVIVRDTSSGRVHKRFLVEGTHQLAAYEGCNADQSGAYSVLTDAEAENVERDAQCRRCYPEDAA